VPYHSIFNQGDAFVTALKNSKCKPRRAPSQRRQPPSSNRRSLPDFSSAPVFSIPETSHFGRWSISTTRRRIEDGSLETVTVAGVVRVKGASLRALLEGGE